MGGVDRGVEVIGDGNVEGEEEEAVVGCPVKTISESKEKYC